MSISNPEFSQTPLMQPVRINPDSNQHHSSTSVLMLAAIGVVFGDIGTSPLYSLKECFAPAHGIPFSEDAVLGIISLIFWSLMLVVTIKYVIFVLRADNHGEGGVLERTAAVTGPGAGRERPSTRWTGWTSRVDEVMKTSSATRSASRG